MRLLMTRPEPDATLSATKLRALGHQVTVDPVLRITFSSKPFNWDGTSDLIATSKNGIRALSTVANPTLKREATLFTVGDASADLAREYGFGKVRSANGTIDELVPLLIEHARKHVTYIAGRDRKGELENKLQARGFTVDLQERYKADMSPALHEKTVDLLKNGAFDAVLLYSKRTAEVFIKLIAKHNISHSTNKLTVFCLANVIRRVFDSENGPQLIVAEEPTEQALFEAVGRFEADF